jgi:YfiH family protein
MTGVELFEWHAPGPYRVAFSTRLGGVSEGAFASLNLGMKTADEPARVAENRRRLCDEVEADPARATMAMQVHGAEVTEARSRGIAAPQGTAFPPCDGLWSELPGLAMALLTADCFPVALARLEGRPALAVLHVGRRGLLEGIVENGVAALGEGALAAAVGPGIGRCCYEVGEDVAGPYRDRFGAEVAADGRLDLRAAVDRALRDAGVEAVEHVDRCTACEPGLFFSHRRDRGVTGRQGVIGYVG